MLTTAATATPFLYYSAWIQVTSTENHRRQLQPSNYSHRTRMGYQYSMLTAPKTSPKHPVKSQTRITLLSLAIPEIMNDAWADDDLVALPLDDFIEETTATSTKITQLAIHDNNDDAGVTSFRLCVIRNQHYVFPLLQREDDVETDLYLDPRYLGIEVRYVDVMNWYCERRAKNNVSVELIPSFSQFYYGVGWYGQRPVPSLGGGPGYGAEATEVWSIDNEILEKLKNDRVHVPVIDVGISHGEKARGGAFF